MSDDDDRTRVRRDPNQADPTSWNGISYDDMMRSLEDALPAEDRVTLSSALPTRPVAFQPAPVTQRMPVPVPVPPASVAPVALPSIALRYVDLDHDYDFEVADARKSKEQELATKRNAKASRRGRKAALVVGAFASVLALGVFTWMNPDAHGRVVATAGGARAFMSGFVANASAERSPPATVVAAPIADAPVAPPIAASPESTPAMATEPPAVPTMRAPTPPPPRRAVKAKARNVEPNDDSTNVAEADPASLLDRGLGE